MVCGLQVRLPRAPAPSVPRRPTPTTHPELVLALARLLADLVRLALLDGPRRDPLRVRGDDPHKCRLRRGAGVTRLRWREEEVGPAEPQPDGETRSDDEGDEEHEQPARGEG